MLRVFGIRLIMAIALAAALAAPAAAQLGAQGVPDLSQFASAIAKSVENPAAEKPNAGGGLFRSGLTVPSVQPGETARDIGRQLRTQIEKQAGPQAGLAQLESGMPQALAELEKQFEAVGLAKRDLGVAMAYTFIQNWETANKQTVAQQPSLLAAKSLAAAVAKHWGPRFSALEPAAQEKIYESLLVSTTLMSAFAEQFAKAGKTAEEDGIRQTAAEMFQKLIGAAPSKVKITDDGRIVGLSLE